MNGLELRTSERKEAFVAFLKGKVNSENKKKLTENAKKRYFEVKTLPDTIQCKSWEEELFKTLGTNETEWEQFYENYLKANPETNNIEQQGFKNAQVSNQVSPSASQPSKKAKSVQTKNNYPIHAYLSYRIQRDKTARDRLKYLCIEQNISLFCAENDINPGDSLIKFMDDLSAARCVFLFLSPEYFKSAYTLYELICINERGDLDRRFIIPLRLTETMVANQWTAAKNCFDGDEALRNELARLLRVKNTEHAAIWQRVNAAWDNIIFKHLDMLNTSLKNADAEEKLVNLIEKLTDEIDLMISESAKKLDTMVGQEIQEILKNENIPTKQLAEQWQLNSTDIKSIVEYGILTKPVIEVLGSLRTLTQKLENQLHAGTVTAKDDYFFDVGQLCGWLILKTVNPVWWFNKQHLLQENANHSATTTFNLQNPTYIEVLISRSLLKSAQFKIDNESRIRPERKVNELLLFDSVSAAAVKKQLLTPIWKDLRPGAFKAPENVETLLKDIILTARSLMIGRKNVIDGKNVPIFYLVSNDYLQTLKNTDWFADAEQKLKGYLYFISYDEATNKPNDQPCIEEQELLLETVATILRLKNPKGTPNE